MPNIADRSPLFQADHEARHACLALMEGLEALKRDAEQDSRSLAAAGQQRYAWPLPGEMTPVESAGKKLLNAYQTKIRAARLENVWRDSLRATAAVPFGSQPTLSGWPASLNGFEKAVDDQGRDLLTWWAESFAWKLAMGVDYALVDMPEQVGGSAYWASVRAGAVLDVEVDVHPRQDLEGAPVLRAVETRLDLSRTTDGTISTDPDEWPQKKLERVIRIYRVAERLIGQVDADEADIAQGRVPVHFRESAKRKIGNTEKWIWTSPWMPLEARSGVFTEIPLVPFYASNAGPYRGRPPFGDTASEQMALWRKTLDYDSRERRDAANIIAIVNAKPGEVSFDGRAVYLPKDASASLLETSGAALEQLRKGRDELKQSIRTGNLRPILSQPTPSRTATEIMVYELSASSQLEMWVLMDLASLRQALTYTSLLNGDTPSPDAAVDIPHDFSLRPEAMTKIWDAVIAGAPIPWDLVWREARRHQWIGEGENPATLAAQSMALASPAAPE